jgi:hypothetical protein
MRIIELNAIVCCLLALYANYVMAVFMCASNGLRIITELNDVVAFICKLGHVRIHV